MPSEPEKSYENILYMFDEIDTETNEILLDRSYKKSKDDKTKTDTELIINTLAHINTKKEDELKLKHQIILYYQVMIN